MSSLSPVGLSPTQVLTVQGRPPNDERILDKVVNDAVNKQRHGHHHHGRSPGVVSATDTQRGAAPSAEGLASLGVPRGAAPDGSSSSLGVPRGAAPSPDGSSSVNLLA
jgi:hypothetical protein